MKRLLFFTFLLFASVQFASAQIRIVKLNLASAFTGTASLSFEHVKKKQFAWQATLTFRPPINGPNFLFNRLEEGWSLNSSKAKVLGAQLAYRWYTQKGRSQSTKPYFALFGQSQHWETQLEYGYDGNIYSIDGNWSQQTFGLQYGVQWVVNDAWSIDLTLVGFGLAFGSITGSAQTVAEPNIGFWEESLGTIPFVGQRILLQGSNKDYTFSDKYVSIGLHTALRIGILF